MNFVSESKGGGIQVAQQPVTQRGLALNQVFDLAYVQLRLRNRLQHTQIVNSIGGNFMRSQYLRTAEEVALEINESSFLGCEEFLAGFHLFRQHAATPGTIAFHHSSGVCWRRGP